MKGRYEYGKLSVIPVVLCMVMVFCLGVWYEREYGLQKEHTGRLMYTAIKEASRMMYKPFTPARFEQLVKEFQEQEAKIMSQEPSARAAFSYGLEVIKNAGKQNPNRPAKPCCI